MTKIKNITSKFFPAAVILFAYFIFLLLTYSFLGRWFTDDAFISFRYAKNLAEGSGLVYNTGERVQGYTNFLWTILIAAFYKLGVKPVRSAVAINIVSTFLLGLVVFSFLRKNYFQQSLTKTFLGTLILISFPNLLAWTIGGGLEGPFFTFLIFTAYFFLFKNKIKDFIISGLIFGISFLVRPEGFLFAFMGVIYLLFFINEKEKKTFILFFSIPFLAIVLLYLSWCYYYYGSIIPNTFYAKFTPITQQFIEGLHYTYTFVMALSITILLVFLSLLNFNKLSHYSRFFLILFFIYIAYIIIVGGDFMPAHRFFLPLMPFLCILTIEITDKLFTGNLRIGNINLNQFPLVIVFIVIFNLFSNSFLPSYKTAITQYKLVENGRKTALFINNHFPGKITIASSGIGALGYYSNNNILDVLGLTEPNIAKKTIYDVKDKIVSHNRSNANYVLSKLPEIIIFGGHPGEKYPVRYAEEEINNNTIFKDKYTYTELPIDTKTTFKFYLRNDIRYKR
jgi:hypothetical protein